MAEIDPLRFVLDVLLPRRPRPAAGRPKARPAA
jgi:hypothetical protein